MKKANDFGMELDYCDNCKVLLADNVLENNSFICYQCCRENKIPYPPSPVLNRWLQREG